MEAGAVAKYPLAFLPEGCLEKLTLVKKAVLFGKVYNGWLETLYSMRGLLGPLFS